ncbi:response regulator [Bacillus sp. ISL-35]|uniref:response regulator n=1 Tax=Bacillus sp. ISL-35 TaxID=2819122 RepID=UPI001BEABD9A|nr:response regulator [Bacillus sp. ISL-35]MBT2679994.1 response regulator [Bacillus sp. ISL-35]MBT2703030.1 response regulator [Chryseobacterium sp. ISL-80]
MIRVLIVDDDPMVAEFNRRYLQEVNGFTLAGIVHTVKDAREFLESEKVDLILLDVYMPGATGIDLLRFIRKKNISADVILITAAADKENIQTALRYGALDYLIKPFEFERFNQALLHYKEKHHFFENHNMLRQEDIDGRILSTEQKLAVSSMENLPKGLTISTLESIIKVIQSKENLQFSTDDISEITLISRVSVRKYLKFLADLGILEESLTYGVGRPGYLYRLRKDKLGQLNRFL